MASLLSQATAGTPKVSPMSATAAKVSPFSAKPSTTMTGPYQSTVGTGQYQSTVPSSGVRAVSPTTNVSKPSTTIPASQQSRTPSAGSYQGVSITPGTDAEVATQIAKINAANAGKNNTSTPTYPGLVGQNIQAQNTQNTQANTQAPVPPPAPQGFSDYVGNIGTTAGALNNTAALLGQQGQVTPEEQAAKNKLAGVPGLLGSTDASIENQPGEFAFQMGREAVAGRNIEAMRQSLADQANAYATTRQANTAAYTAQTNAQNAAGGLYGNAANYAQPQLGSIGQVPFNPLNQNQGAILGSTQPGGLTAAGTLLGQFNGAQASGAAAGNAQASVVGTQTQQIAGYQSALQQGQNLQSQLSDLITTFGLNPNDVNAVNQGIQKIAQNTSSPQYKILQNYVNDIANTYAQILTPPGGSATDTTRGIANSMLDATASGQSLQQVMHSLDEAAKAKIAGVSTTGSNTNSGNTGGSVSAGGYSFVQDANGKWVPKK